MMNVANSGLLANGSDDSSRTPIDNRGALDNDEHLVGR